MHIIPIILGVLAAIAATVLTFIFLLPEKCGKSENKFVRFLHDIVSFKSLLIDKILKALYVFSTVFCIVAGFVMLFSFTPGYYGIRWNGAAGFALMLLGPIAVRVLYELMMMFVILVQNTIEIRRQLGDKKLPTQEEEASGDAPAAEPEYRYCTKCGTRYDINQGGCPNGCEQ